MWRRISLVFEGLDEFCSGDDGIKDLSHDFDSHVEAEQKPKPESCRSTT